jgi:hypothetical protein
MDLIKTRAAAHPHSACPFPAGLALLHARCGRGSSGETSLCLDPFAGRIVCRLTAVRTVQIVGSFSCRNHLTWNTPNCEAVSRHALRLNLSCPECNRGWFESKRCRREKATERLASPIWKQYQESKSRIHRIAEGKAEPSRTLFQTLSSIRFVLFQMFRPEHFSIPPAAMSGAEGATGTPGRLPPREQIAR